MKPRILDTQPSITEPRVCPGTDPVIVDCAAQLKQVLGERLRELWLYGSRARGEARPDSDYDLLVLLDRDATELRERVLDVQVEMLDLHDATFLPYRIDDRARLHDQAPLAYRRIQQAPLPERTRTHCLDVFQSWLAARFEELPLEDILTMLGELTPFEQTRAYREIVAKNQPIWLTEGRKEGRKEGRQREANMALRQLRRRLGHISDAQQSCVQALSFDQLEDLGEALLDFTTPAELDAWFEAHPQPPQAD